MACAYKSRTAWGQESVFLRRPIHPAEKGKKKRGDPLTSTEGGGERGGTKKVCETDKSSVEGEIPLLKKK